VNLILFFFPIIQKLEAIYSTASVDGKRLDPDLEETLSKSRDYIELQNAYIGWRDVTGPKMKDLYEEFVDLINQGARETGYKDGGDMWYVTTLLEFIFILFDLFSPFVMIMINWSFKFCNC